MALTGSQIEARGRSKMSSLKITFLPLAICFVLSLNSQVSARPRPKYFLIETKEMTKRNSDYINNINNSGGINTIIYGSNNVDYTDGINPYYACRFVLDCHGGA